MQVWEIAAELSASHESIRPILNNHLGIKHVALHVAFLDFAHDNAPSHKAIIMNEFLTRNFTNTIDFFLFPQLKLPLRGTRYSIEDIKENSRRELNSIPEKAF